MEHDQDSSTLAKNTLDKIPSPSTDARRITGLIKESGRVTGYELSDHTRIEKAQAVQLARMGGIAGVGIAHRGDTEYLKSIPDGRGSNNLSNLPSISAAEQ